MKKNNHLYTYFILSITLLLLISTSFQPSLARPHDNKNDQLIFVDDDNSQGPWDGSMDHPFQRINDAIDVSNDQSIIFIFNGNYEETIFIENQADMIGEDTINTLIYGSIVIQESNNVKLSNFTISSVEEIDEDDIGINLITSDHCAISNIVVTNHYTGILVSSVSTMNVIKENTVVDNIIGIDICTSTNNIIYGNTLDNNQLTNLILYHSNGNHISQNIIENAEHNLQFHTSKDIITKNYWGNQKNIQFFKGYQTIKGLIIVIPWFKILFNSLNDISQIQINPIAIMKTSLGSMYIELSIEKQPITSQNFIDLSEIDFFNGLVFHRVIDDFVIQGGGFDVNGSNKDSPFGTIPLETHPEVLHDDGAISMARTNDPDSATSQFFICDGAQHGLDGNYAAFGKILVGFETLRTITEVGTTTKHFMQDWPIEEVIINNVMIL